jgi:hypothetical protein
MVKEFYESILCHVPGPNHIQTSRTTIITIADTYLYVCLSFFSQLTDDDHRETSYLFFVHEAQARKKKKKHSVEFITLQQPTMAKSACTKAKELFLHTGSTFQVMTRVIN